MSEYYSVLIVDDDIRYRKNISHFLQTREMKVKDVGNGAEMDAIMQKEIFDLIVLDVMMPGEDGLSICRRLRGQKQDIPIIIVSARGDPIERILGLECGADDYLAKPIEPLELYARINSVMRRQSKMLPSAPVKGGVEVKFGQFVLNLKNRDLLKNGVRVPLTSADFALLKVFANHPKEPLTRDKLMLLAKGKVYNAVERAIDVHISRLRKLVEEDPHNPQYIQTVWGSGYIFIPDEDD